MANQDITIGQEGTYTQEIGFPSDPGAATSLRVSIVNTSTSSTLGIIVRVSHITLRRPWLSIDSNPSITRVPDRYVVSFSAGLSIEDVSTSDAYDPASPHFGKLLYGLGMTVLEGPSDLGQTVANNFGEDPYRDLHFCGRYLSGGTGIISGVLSMNPGWKYTHNRRNPTTGNWEYAHADIAYPRILTLADPFTVAAGERTVLQFVNNHSDPISTPNSTWDYDAFNYSTVPRYRIPDWAQEYALRQSDLQVGSDINSGISLCHSYYNVPRCKQRDPSHPQDPVPPCPTRSLQLESKISITFTATRV